MAHFQPMWAVCDGVWKCVHMGHFQSMWAVYGFGVAVSSLSVGYLRRPRLLLALYTLWSCKCVNMSTGICSAMFRFYVSNRLQAARL
jgi:hypothetical protein